LIADGSAQKVQSYIDGVLSGDIVVSELVRCAVQRHVDDLKRTDGLFYFDAYHAGRVLQFFPLLIRHSIGRFKGQPFELEPWQAFMVWCVFGCIKTDGTRRFSKWYCSMGRKNGKSTLAAAVAFYMTMADIHPSSGQPESVAQTVLTATKKDQVIKVIYQEMQRMRKASPVLTRMCRNINQQFMFAHNEGQIICVGSDKPFDGLNPSLVINDELHAWREHHREFYDTMTTGGAARDQPLQMITTTAGDDKSHLWLEEYTYCASVCRGDIVDDSVFAFVAEVDEKDDVFDESVWVKANPNIGVSVSWDYLRTEAVRLSQTSIGRNKFTRYHGNRIVTSTEKVFDMAEWDACEGVLSDWNQSDAVGVGVDIGARDDLAGEGYAARFPIGEKDGKPVYRFELNAIGYLSTETHRDCTKQPFQDYIYRGFIKQSGYPLAEMTESVLETARNYHAENVAYDPANGQSFAEDIKRGGLTPVRMSQTHAMFNEPIRDLLQAIKERRIVHDGNPLLRWCVSNAMVYRDRKDLWMYDKKTSSEKIDLIVAVTMAFRICSLAPARYRGALYL
jgi:phage terminase large subunit-like protein